MLPLLIALNSCLICNKWINSISCLASAYSQIICQIACETQTQAVKCLGDSDNKMKVKSVEMVLALYVN